MVLDTGICKVVIKAICSIKLLSYHDFKSFSLVSLISVTMESLLRQVELIAIQNGFVNYKIIVEKGSDLGFIGILEKYRIVEGDRELSLMCKFLPESEEQNECYNSFLLFEREVFVYRQLLTEFEKLQIDNGFEYRDADGFWAFPKCYFANYDQEYPTKSIIIMEDLTTENFSVKNKFTPSDFNHTRKLFIELAKFHALSFVMKVKKPEVFEKFKQIKCSMYSVMTTDSMKHLAPRNVELASKLFDDDEGEIRDKVLSFKDCLWQRIQVILDGKLSEPYSVILHGDIWINNVMFNYHKNNEDDIKETRLVDWQMTYYGSVGCELTNYLFCCVDKTVRDQYKDDLLRIYYSTMEKFLLKFSLDIKKVFPYHAFEEQLRKFGLFSFGMASFALPLLCKYPEQLFDNEKTELSEEEYSNLNNYNQRMRSTILDMIEMKIL